VRPGEAVLLLTNGEFGSAAASRGMVFPAS
jgi:hypothetical protein